MSDLMMALIKSLIANGVKVPADEPVCFGGEKVSPAYNLDAIILDFSEHDKVFEAEIAELENFINHKLGDWDKHGISCQEIMDMKSENDKLKKKISDLESLIQKRDKFLEIKNIQIEELKQRIAELESKETEKPTKINLNDRVKVKLTPLGAEIYYHQYDEVNKKIKANGGKGLEPTMPEIDKDGFTEFQLWHFMELYGERIGMCKPNVIEPLNIIIEE